MLSHSLAIITPRLFVNDLDDPGRSLEAIKTIGSWNIVEIPVSSNLVRRLLSRDLPDDCPGIDLAELLLCYLFFDLVPGYYFSHLSAHLYRRWLKNAMMSDIINQRLRHCIRIQ